MLYLSGGKRIYGVYVIGVKIGGIQYYGTIVDDSLHLYLLHSS